MRRMCRQQQTVFANKEIENGTVGMNGLEGRYVVKNNKKLACGYTTGSCAAAAAKAATIMLFTGERQDRITLPTPKGILLSLEVKDISFSGTGDPNQRQISCAVLKDAGDDPDVTNSTLVYATVSKRIGPDAEVLLEAETGAKLKDKANGEQEQFLPDSRWQVSLVPGITVFIDGGIGVGRVTKPGLEQPVGSAAINRVPREMIASAVSEVCQENGYQGEIYVEISVPEGKKLAPKTFNPRLGITGGISILGTSGIVEPMSEAALLASIRLEMKMKRANGVKNLVIAPGNYGTDYLAAHLPVSKENVVKCSNFVGETVDMAVELGYEGILFVSHIGKFIKVAGGIMNTHSRNADARMEILCANALQAGADRGTLSQIMEALTTDEGLHILKNADLLEATMEQVMEKIAFYLKKRCYERLQIGVILFSNEYGELGKIGPVDEMTEQIIREKEKRE